MEVRHHLCSPASTYLACLLAFASTSAGATEGDAQLFLKAKAAGGYIAAADLMVRIKGSPCGYIVKKPPPSPGDRAREVEAAFAPGEARELRTFLSSSEYQRKLKRNQDLIDGMLHQSINVEGLDTRTACGMLVGTLAPLIGDAEVQWKRAAGK
jgi:hypothetical protein